MINEARRKKEIDWKAYAAEFLKRLEDRRTSTFNKRFGNDIVEAPKDRQGFNILIHEIQESFYNEYAQPNILNEIKIDEGKVYGVHRKFIVDMFDGKQTMYTIIKAIWDATIGSRDSINESANGQVYTKLPYLVDDMLSDWSHNNKQYEFTKKRILDNVNYGNFTYEQLENLHPDYAGWFFNTIKDTPKTYYKDEVDTFNKIFNRVNGVEEDKMPIYNKAVKALEKSFNEAFGTNAKFEAEPYRHHGKKFYVSITDKTGTFEFYVASVNMNYLDVTLLRTKLNLKYSNSMEFRVDLKTGKVAQGAPYYKNDVKTFTDNLRIDESHNNTNTMINESKNIKVVIEVDPTEAPSDYKLLFSKGKKLGLKLNVVDSIMGMDQVEIVGDENDIRMLLSADPYEMDGDDLDDLIDNAINESSNKSDKEVIEHIIEYLDSHRYGWESNNQVTKAKRSLKKAIASVGYSDTKKLADELVYTDGWSEEADDIKEWLDDAMKELNESKEDSITVDVYDIDDATFEKYAKKFNVKVKSGFAKTPSGPQPELTITGDRANIKKYLMSDLFEYDDEEVEDLFDEYLNESGKSNKNGVSARLKELLLNESEAVIKHFAINESAIVLPNGNITYTVDGGRTWNFKINK